MYHLKNEHVGDDDSTDGDDDGNDGGQELMKPQGLIPAVDKMSDFGTRL